MGQNCLGGNIAKNSKSQSSFIGQDETPEHGWKGGTTAEYVYGCSQCHEHLLVYIFVSVCFPFKRTKTTTSTLLVRGSIAGRDRHETLAESRWHTCKIFEVLAAPFVNNQLPRILLLARSEERGPIGIYYILMEGGWVWVWLDRCKNRGWESYMHDVDVVLVPVLMYLWIDTFLH